MLHGQAQAALWLEEILGLKLTPMQRPALERQSYFECQGYGKNLRYALWLDGGWLNFVAEGLDQTDGPSKPLLTIEDGAKGFEVVCKLIAAMERSGIKRVELPLQLGEPPNPDCWVIVS